MLKSVVCSSQKERYEKQARGGIARGKRKTGEELRRALGRGALSPRDPEGFFSLTLSFPVLLVPTTVEPLH